MDVKDLKLTLAYSKKYKAAKIVSKMSRHVRSMEIEEYTSKENDDTFEYIFNRLEKLLNNRTMEKRNAFRRNPTCWKCHKQGPVQRECQKITSNQKNKLSAVLWGKGPEEELKVSTIGGEKNGLYLEGSICDIPYLLLVRAGANKTLIRTKLVKKLKE
ncbi:CCHC-type domain-containing protein [Nephila pilipes]|uniref:CCHC-type domain-containing protein n=1 Tax=Nephila pilipes TaxID=299642 RepID=A0A8X6R0N0_NEPPI|nr:CCHC-type domain-containing protein [Nephila pilipes]